MNVWRGLTAIGFVAVAMLLGRLWLDQKLRGETEEREAYFLSVHAITGEMVTETYADDPRPANLQELLQKGPWSDLPRLLRPFPQGLDFKWVGDGDSWTLAEPAPRSVAFFRKDRLVASDQDFPHWEASGIRATKGRR